MAPSKKRDKDVVPLVSMDNVNISGTSSSVSASMHPSITPVAADGADSTKLYGHQQEQELFLQAFEKPTQIYRYLRNRHETSPMFLNRTLTYMKDRMSRNNKRRVNYKINSILDTITHKTEIIGYNYLHIIYDGLYETSGDTNGNRETYWKAGDSVCVDTTLYKITRSKRKDCTVDFQDIVSKSSNVIYNQHDNMEYETITLPVQSMRPIGDQHTLYKLLFRVKYMSQPIPKYVESEGTPNKRLTASAKIYGCELILYEKLNGFIAEGEYEADLQPFSSSSIKSFSPKKRTWETMPDNYIPLSMKYDTFHQNPILKFRLILSNVEIPVRISANELHKYTSFANVVTLERDTEVNHNNNSIKNGVRSRSASDVNGKNLEQVQIVYNFMYSNNTRQQTEYTQEVICPWCSLDCMRLYSLLKHLKLCHARFNFTYKPAGNGGACIDVTINDAYDGSYSGSPYDLAGPSGSSFARTCGPVRRTMVTNLLVWRPRRQKTCLDEFLVLDEDELGNQRSYITGHNRLYHHTETCLPVHPKVLDIDSEGESDPLWLRQKTIQMIDEFSDVNEGEKELMKLWNLHVMKHGYVGDCQLPLACEMFLDVNGHEIIRKNLYRNFILHMTSLFDYGLVSPETVYKTVQKLQGMLSKYSQGQEIMSTQRETQLKYWLEIGIFKQDEQKLKSPKKQKTIDIRVSDSNSVNNTNNSFSTSMPMTAYSTLKAEHNNKTMQPPKRMQTNLKRISSVNNTLEGTVKVQSNGGTNGLNKCVAKKSADHMTAGVQRERRSEEQKSMQPPRRLQFVKVDLKRDNNHQMVDKKLQNEVNNSKPRSGPMNDEPFSLKRHLLSKESDDDDDDDLDINSVKIISIAPDDQDLYDINMTTTIAVINDEESSSSALDKFEK